MTEQQFPAWMERTVQLIGPENAARFMKSHVLVAGMGGVGSAAAEHLVRSGIGAITLVDPDIVQASNMNRQIPALHSTLGQYKTRVMEQRLLDINPALQVQTFEIYIAEDTIGSILSGPYDYVIDAIDTLTPKILFIYGVRKREMNLVSSMGSGGRTDPTRVMISDFSETYGCRLAYLLRKKLRKMGITGGFKAVFSSESVGKDHLLLAENEINKKSIPGTVSYIPALFGAFLASVVINDLVTPENK